ncbi:MAG: hypothetical protein OXF79_23995 [Chloroflexi bacterium]|nr:hypothetical protein [Chloroflexota bacterium]
MSGASIPKSILSIFPSHLAKLPAYKEAHPVVREAIMDYDGHVYAVDAVNERDCSPHPLDVMAVGAL